MSTAQVAVLVVAVLLGVGFLLLTLFVSRRRRQVADEVRERLGGDVVLADDRARCFGVESRGSGALQAMGCLALSGDRLLFVQWSPRDELELRREDLLGLDDTTWHLGHERHHDLVRIRFRNPAATWEREQEGEADDEGVTGEPGDAESGVPQLAPGEDAVAFQVEDAGSWRTALGRSVAT